MYLWRLIFPSTPLGTIKITDVINRVGRSFWPSDVALGTTDDVNEFTEKIVKVDAREEVFGEG